MGSAAGVSTQQDTRRSPAMRYGLLPVLVVVASLVATTIVSLVLRNQIQDREQDRLQAAAERAAEQIEARFDLYAEELFDVRPMFEGDPHRTTRAEFQSWLEVSGVFERLAGIQALSFVRVVASADRETFEAAVRQDTSANGIGYPEFEVHPDSEASHLFVVDFIEPMEGNEAAFGFDLGTNPDRLKAVETARDTSDLTATAPITLVQETEKQKGILLLLGVYATPSVPATEEVRRSSFTGLISAVFRIDDMLAGALGDDPQVILEIYDVGRSDAEPLQPAEAGLLSDSDPSARTALEADNSPDVTMTEISIGGRRWLIVAEPTPALRLGQDASPWIALAVGIALSLLLGGLVASVEAERELQRSRDSALGLTEAKSDFVTTVSHEIRSPLHAILGFSELLENQLSSEGRNEATEWSSRVRSEAERLTRLIEDLLDLSRLDAGRTKIASAKFSLRRLVDDVIQISRLKADSKGLHLGVSVDPTVSDWRTGDADRLHQVLLNLVSNATKFTREGRIDVEISPAASRANADLVRFAVTDTGPGIPGEEIDRILEPFAQVWRSDADRGSGLGLAISDKLVRAMGGDGLAISSLEGHGSTFHFTLPLSESQEPASSQESGSTQTDSNRTILIVDDNATNQMLIEAQLNKLGYSCEVASDGAEALERLKSGRFDAVLMDCHMPGMGGYEATRRIRAGERGTGVHIPVLALTASAMGSNRDACERAGMDGFLTKPLSLSSLAAEIRRFLGTGEADGLDLEAEASCAGQDMSKAPILDDARVDRLLVELGPGPLQKVASTFIAEMPRRLAELCRVAAERDADAVRRSAHAMRSPSAMLGAALLAEHLRAVEESTDPVSSVSEARLSDLIDASVEQLRARLSQFVDQEGGAQ